ncbi:MAG: oligosaccharide flippase family protein [Candidatus Rokubacteria bacterium]|nr:oligosaccharide flippase family protein [Candidatus Rokubacteria bacterium]
MNVRRDLVRGSTSALGFQGFELALNYALHLMLAVWLSATGYGIYAFVVALGRLLSVFGQVGLHTAVMRFVAASRAQEAWGRLRGVLSISNRVALTASLTILAIVEAAIWLYAESIDDTLRASMQIGMLLVPLAVLSGLRQRALRGLKWFIASQLPENIVVPAAMIVGVLLAQAWGADTPVVAVTIRVAAVALAFVLGTVLLVRALPAQVRQARPEIAVREVLSVSVPMMFGTSMQIMFTKTDTLMLGFFNPMADVGVYSLVAQIALVASFGRLAINVIAHPLIAEAYATGRQGVLQRVVSLASLGATAYGLVVCAGVVVFGGWFLGTFGADFRAGLTPLLVLLAAEVVKNVFCLAEPLLTMTAYQVIFSRIVFGAVLLNVVLNALLIPAYGMTGAAVATAIATIAWKLVSAYFVVRHLRINPTLATRRVLDRVARQAAATVGGRW